MRRPVLFLLAVVIAPALLGASRPISRDEVNAIAGRVVAALKQRVEKPVKDIERLGEDQESYSFLESMDSVRTLDIGRWSADPVWEPSGKVTVHLTLQAHASGWDGSPVRFPEHWTIRIEDAGGHAVITAITNDEAAVAYQMLQPQSDDERECLLDSGPDLDRAKVLKYLADDLASLAFRDKFEEAYVFVFEWARRQRDVDLVIACTTLASTRALMRDDTSMAIALAEHAADLSSQRQDLDAWTSAMFVGAIAKWRAGKIDDALWDLRKASDRFPSLHKRTTALKADYMYAFIAETRGDAREVIRAAERLSKRSHEIGWGHGEALADWLIANTEGTLRNNGLALEYHRRIYERFRRTGEEVDATLALADIGNDEAQLGNLKAARRDYTEALRHMKGWYWAIEVGASLSSVLIDLRRFAEAEEVLDGCDATPTTDPSMRADTALVRSELAFARGRFGEAVEFSRQAIAIGNPPGGVVSYRTLWPAQNALARALAASGRIDDAEVAYRDAISLIEAQRSSVSTDDFSRVRFYDDKVMPYRGLAELLAGRGKADEALAVTEAVRARALRDIIGQGKIDLDAALAPDELKTKHSLEDAVTARTRASIATPSDAPVRRELEQARLALENFNAIMAVQHGRSYSGTIARQDGSVTGDSLRPDEVAVEYLVGERRTLAFVISAQHGKMHVRVRSLPVGSRRLRALVHRLSEAVRQRDIRWADASRAVYDAILRPIAPSLISFRHICVIPDGDLWSVPFEVLRDPAGIPLIEKASVSYSPSILMLRDMRRIRPASGSHVLLAMGNPVVGSRTRALVRSLNGDLPLGALPDAEREVERLRDLYGASHVDIRVGAAARESLFKAEAGRYRILHLATHGAVDDRSPMYSCLVLAPDARDDGLLEMREIVNLDLHADLAVLSSCDTARGQISRGEGVVGIAWAFLAAGCPTTVVSQWKVDSEATERLMVAFHRNLIRSRFRAKADALRDAKLALMKDPRYRHPFFWAPFIVVGSP